MKAKKPEKIKGVIGKVIEKIEGQEPDKKEKITDAWRKVVGKKANKHSRPVAVQRKKLTVEVDSSTWLYELNLKKTEILSKLKKETDGANLEDIRFKMGETN